MALFGNLLLSVGAMKAGTSWLYHMLSQRPDVETTPIKETLYFWERHGNFRVLTREQRIATVLRHLRRLLPTATPDEVPNLLRWFERYLSEPVDDAWFAGLFASRGGTGYCAEFSNLDALLGAEGWAHVRALCRSLRVVYTLRHPVERMWSHTRFHAHIIGRFDELGTWDAAQFIDFVDRNGIAVHGEYARVIRTLRAALDDSELLICRYDDVCSQPLQVLRRIEAFLDLPAHAYPETAMHLVRNPTPQMDMPAAFRAAMKDRGGREVQELQGLGVELPAAWMSAQAER